MIDTKILKHIENFTIGSDMWKYFYASHNDSLSMVDEDKSISRRAERVMIFIDGSNFYKSIKESFHGILPRPINEPEFFKKLIFFLKRERLLVKTCYYTAPLDRGFNPTTYSKQPYF